MNQLIMKAKSLKPVLRVGKAGLTEGMLSEIRHQLKKKKLIKIKLLKSCLHNKTKSQLLDEIINKTNSKLISNVGNVISLHKKQ